MTIQRSILITLFIVGVLGRFSVALAAIPEYSVETIPEYDAVFERTMGWTGGDGVYSVGLGKDVTLWLFSDTWIGPVVNGRHKDAVLVNNTVAIQKGPVPLKNNVEFYWGKAEDGKPEALIKPADELIVTYVCNAMDFWQMAKDARIYRPRFLRIKYEIPH